MISRSRSHLSVSRFLPGSCRHSYDYWFQKKVGLRFLSKALQNEGRNDGGNEFEKLSNSCSTLIAQLKEKIANKSYENSSAQDYKINKALFVTSLNPSLEQLLEGVQNQLMSLLFQAGTAELMPDDAFQEVKELLESVYANATTAGQIVKTIPSEINLTALDDLDEQISNATRSDLASLIDLCDKEVEVIKQTWDDFFKQNNTILSMSQINNEQMVVEDTSSTTLEESGVREESPSLAEPATVSNSRVESKVLVTSPPPRKVEIQSLPQTPASSPGVEVSNSASQSSAGVSAPASPPPILPRIAPDQQTGGGEDTNSEDTSFAEKLKIVRKNALKQYLSPEEQTILKSIGFVEWEKILQSDEYNVFDCEVETVLQVKIDTRLTNVYSAYRDSAGRLLEAGYASISNANPVSNSLNLRFAVVRNDLKVPNSEVLGFFKKLILPTAQGLLSSHVVVESLQIQPCWPCKPNGSFLQETIGVRGSGDPREPIASKPFTLVCSSSAIRSRKNANKISFHGVLQKFEEEFLLGAVRDELNNLTATLEKPIVLGEKNGLLVFRCVIPTRKSNSPLPFASVTSCSVAGFMGSFPQKRVFKSLNASQNSPSS